MAMFPKPTSEMRLEIQYWINTAKRWLEKPDCTPGTRERCIVELATLENMLASVELVHQFHKNWDDLITKRPK